ncbi:hypothetical protein B0T22DRAFT_453229 [Podospora appendiculata]|uniref:Uncharacterized protein n=1 Tax=Podospora appendiculata TaxID=314037 RepID=A0AAE0XJJ3_9PEZI|nr:hypothetical protein B0T22DRAFT_453229 [Podospora appendiculata]
MRCVALRCVALCCVGQMMESFERPSNYLTLLAANKERPRPGVEQNAIQRSRRFSPPDALQNAHTQYEVPGKARQDQVGRVADQSVCR